MKLYSRGQVLVFSLLSGLIAALVMLGFGLPGRLFDKTDMPDLQADAADFSPAGHTDAEYENMVEGMQAGILHSTHFFNAMRRLDHHNPNAVGAILIHPEMSCEIIADGFHVHPDLFKLLLRNKPIDKIVLVTDGLKPTEQKEGPLFANREEVCFRDGAFHRKSDGVLAGSGLTMIRGIQNLVTSGFSLEEAVKTASFNPAQIMRYNNQGAIIPSRFADITVFDKNFNIRLVMISGRIVKDMQPGN